MMHFKNTEVAFAPMMRGEIQYWLSTGCNIFEHRGQYWMRVLHYTGHRIMIPVLEDQLLSVNPRLYTKTGKIFRGVKQ